MRGRRAAVAMSRASTSQRCQAGGGLPIDRTAYRWPIRATGANIISRIMGIILATIAVDAVLGGLETVGVVDLVPAQEGVLDTSPAT